MREIKMLNEELLKELLGEVPKSLLEELKEDIEKELKNRVENDKKKLTREQEHEIVDCSEKAIITFLYEVTDLLSTNSTMLLLFNILLGVEESLRGVLDDKEFNHYKEVIRKGKELKEKSCKE